MKRIIPTIKRDDVNALIERRIIMDGMIPKIREAAYAKAGGVGKVWITCWDSSGLEPLVQGRRLSWNRDPINHAGRPASASGESRSRDQ